MKILVATLGHPPDDDRLFHRESVTLVQAGHEVTLFTRGHESFDPHLAGFHHQDPGYLPLKAYGAVLARYARRWRPDVLHVRAFELLPVAGQIKKELGIPLVYDVGEYHREMWTTFSSKPPVIKQLVVWGLLRFEKSQLKHVDCVLANTRQIQERYRRWCEHSVFVPSYPRLRPVDLDRSREPVVIYHGQLSPERGMSHLIRAFADVSEAVPEARLELYGTERVPGLNNRLQESVNRLGLGRAISIRQRIPHEEILSRLAQVQVGVIPFTDAPLFRVAPANKLFEFMLAGCAVVASDLPVMREAGRDAVHYVPPGDVDALREGLVKVLKDPDLRRALAHRGRELVETRYNWDRMEPEFLKIYENLV